MRVKHFISFLLVLVVAIGLIPPGAQAQDEYESLVRRALSELGTNCANLDQNSACYGFPDVTATFSDTASLAAPGDRAALTTLSTLQTSALSLVDEKWGVAVMNVQANVPGALDNSAVFTLLGDVEVTNEVAPDEALVLGEPVAVTTVAETAVLGGPGVNAAVLGTVAGGTLLQADGVSPSGLWVRVMYEENVAWVSSEALDPGTDLSGLAVVRADSLSPMQMFTFRTGGDAPPSLVVPPNVLVAQAPRNTEVEIVANEAHIRFTGVIFLRTLPDGRSQLIVGDGLAALYPDAGNEVNLVPGTSVIFGGGTWTNWRVVPGGEWESFGSLEFIPGNVLIEVIVIPVPIEPSGIGEVVIIIETPTGEWVLVPPQHISWPDIVVDYGTLGNELEHLAWEPFEVGCAVCLPELVLYHSDADGDWDIYRLNEEGTSTPANNVTNGPQTQDLQPTYSADSEWVAFTSNREIAGGWEIFVVKPDGSDLARLTFNTGNDVNPVWGPSNLIAWESNRDGNWELYMADVSTDGLPVRLTDDPANDINPYWFPDGGCDQPEGGRLVFQSDRDGDWEIYMLDVFTLELTQLTDNDTEDQVPVLSRDGTMMAWQQLNDFGVYDLWVMDMGTLEAELLAAMGVDINGHTFATDGTFLAFHAKADGDFDIFTVALEAAVTKAVTINGAEDRAPSFYCESDRIVYHSDIAAEADNPDQRELFEVNPLPLVGPANASARLTTDGADDIYPISDPHDEINSKEGRVPAHP